MSTEGVPQLPPPNPNAPLQGAAGTVNATGLTVVIWVPFGVSTLLVATRMAVRLRQHSALLIDDGWILLAWCTQLTMAILQTQQFDSLWYITEVSAGRFYPGPEAEDKFYQLVRWQFPVIKLFWTVLWSVKASFLSLFYGLVKQNRVLKRCWWAIVVFVGLAYIGCWLASSLTCSPPGDYFKPGRCDSPGERWRSRFNVLFSTSVDVASDLMIMSLPLALLPKLQLDLRTKIGLGVAFCLGWLIIAVAIVRMSQVIANDTVDLVGLAIWGAVEAATAVVVGCLPALKAFLVEGVRAIYSSTMAKSSKRGEYSGGYGSSGGGGHGSRNRRREDGLGTHGSARADGAIPLDDVGGQHGQDKGQIFVHRTFEAAYLERGSSRDDDDEANIMPRPRNPEDARLRFH